MFLLLLTFTKYSGDWLIGLDWLSAVPLWMSMVGRRSVLLKMLVDSLVLVLNFPLKCICYALIILY